ncbi:hypothetical protein ASC77_20745 [Nocardioides sp. Root1257]|uniref:hypothetical protein n=1 Tax=unclassified Nocardioides TaxID=2615069 RepID=UPI0007018FD7|nr:MULTISPECIES: hypothetical protein [unclassified Nocardioides]KQW45203.1 hypothetical protein ASC77_20745 [Nocardioides sp. Root1257]KRC52522.1 hypothetical protein ASE24_25315 [Nocardioides sp. Root224]
MARRLILAALVAAALLVPAPAFADARVSVTPGSVDPTYATTVQVSGSGFQSIKGGHGGVYVFFGTVDPGWQPSKGGVTGQDYYYVPDSESKDNQGFQRFVAFPGSDTASSANGGSMSASGAWSTQIVVPGATFQTYDRAGAVHTVDCRKVTCGVITVGAHGITNAHNETFTPVTIGSSTSGATSSPSATPTGGSTAAADPTAPATAEPGAGATAKPAGPATLEVDRGSAVAGNVLAFHATGLPSGTQVSAVFDDGAAGAGPFVAGTDGSLAGVITLPAGTGPGTHELRLYGVDAPPSVSFAVQPAETTTEGVETQAADEDDTRAAWLFAGAAALVLLVASVRLGLGLRRRRRAA